MQDEVTVTQADREAAIQALNAAERQRSFGGNGTVLGQVAEIFARHRHQAERETLARMEPVAVIGNNWQLLWGSGEMLTDIVARTGIKVGSILYALPPTPEAGQ